MARKEKLKGIDVGSESQGNYEDVTSLDEAQSKGLMGLMNVKQNNIDKLSQIDNELELKHLAVMKMISREFDVGSVGAFVDDYLSLKISFQRKGRGEIVNVLGTTIQQKAQEGLKGMLGRLRGMM